LHLLRQEDGAAVDELGKLVDFTRMPRRRERGREGEFC